MLSFYKTDGNTILPAQKIEAGAWINLVNPTETEVNYVIAQLNVEGSFIRAALDEEETSRVEIEDGNILLIIDTPIAEKQEEGVMYSTIPLGIVITKDNITTICLKDTSVINDFIDGKVKNIQTSLKTRFILNILLRIANRFLYYLKQIDKMSSHVEKQLYKSLKNKEVIQLLTLEKSLVYFTTSLKANDVTLEKVMRGRIIKLYEDDQDLLEDVLIEIKQAIEMANIYSSILSGMMDAFASLISNNLNIIMKVLTVITILMTIPNIIFSYYGMNVSGLPMPFSWFPIVIAAVLTLIGWLILKRRNLN